KKKDVWAYIETLGYFRDFYLEFVEWNESNGFYDFVYLDTESSTFNISYEEE
ncbi:bleomycin hydrolase, partial [Escherichia coli]|nr:bleomycin hydrolase [Escherichia coli]